MRTLVKTAVGLALLAGILSLAPVANAYQVFMGYEPTGSWSLTLRTWGLDYSNNMFAFDRIEFMWLSGDKFEAPWVNSISNSWTLQHANTLSMAIAGPARPANTYVQYTLHFGPDNYPPSAMNIYTYSAGVLKEKTYTSWDGSHLTDYDLPIPEPALLPALGLGLAALGLIWRRRNTR